MAYGRRNFTAYQGRATHKDIRVKAIAFLAVTVLYTAFLYRKGGAGSYLGKSADSEVRVEDNPAGDPTMAFAAMKNSGRKLSISTWNIAAINNNPFEYWITVDNPVYEDLMLDVENFIESPGKKDVSVEEVFTEAMFDKLDRRLVSVGWESVKTYWDSDFKNRKIISGFVKDPLLGSKRLASMPDRVTNTINVYGADLPVCRPTVINMYDGDLSTMDMWYSAWEAFMFDTPLPIKTSDGVKQTVPFQMLQPIKKSKYPDITVEEEKVSLPLQTLCGAIFDAILVHMMNTVSGPNIWQPLKRTMVESLNLKKVPNTLQILETVYSSSDIITLQEVSSALVYQARERDLGNIYHIISPSNMNPSRDQNSIILLKKETFPNGATREITDLVEAAFPEGASVPIAQGDILAIVTVDIDNIPYVVASFHGDTNGLATIPVVTALSKVMKSDPSLAGHKLIFGLDANTYEKAKKGKTQDVLEFGSAYVDLGLTSSWGDVPQPGNYTTYNARTYLQPQLNKACKKSDKRQFGDVNPKDFILFGKNDFKVVQTLKDNTGQKKYIEDMAFPTLDFPSDHGILSTIITPK